MYCTTMTDLGYAEKVLRESRILPHIMYTKLIEEQSVPHKSQWSIYISNQYHSFLPARYASDVLELHYVGTFVSFRSIET